MSTRHKTDAGAPSQERYMSSNEFSELRGVSGIAVSARAAVTLSGRKQNFLWWLQAQSLAEGGLKRLAKELLKTFPDRIGTPAMHEAKADKICSPELVQQVELDLKMRKDWYKQSATKKPRDELVALCVEFALSGKPSTQDSPYDSHGYSWEKLTTLEEFFIDLCINPRICFSAPGDEADYFKIESDLAIEQNEELSKKDFKNASVIYFRDIIGALFEVMENQQAKIKADFQLTEIGRKIWETLDYALASRGMVVLDGLEGRGKTEAVKAWCELHLGSARFVSLKGISSKTTAFREIAKALGIASSYTRTATEMQARIEDVLKRSELMLVIDEAHFVFNQSQRMYSRPELVDWIDTAVCNRGVPIALVTTPQFMVCMTRAADQIQWNYRQFRRRVKRWIKLPATNTTADIKAVAQSVFKKANAEMISKIAGYALLSRRDLSAVGDIAAEVRVMLGHADLSQATAAQIQKAIYDFLMPSDKTFLEDMAAARKSNPKPGRKPTAAPAPVATFEDAPEQPEAETLPRHERGNLGASGSRLASEFKAPLIEA